MSHDAKLRALTRGMHPVEFEKLLTSWLAGVSIATRNRINARVQMLDRRKTIIAIGETEKVTVGDASDQLLSEFCAKTVYQDSPNRWGFLPRPLQACLEEAARRGLLEGINPEDYTI